MPQKRLWANLYKDASSFPKQPNTESLSCWNQPHFPAQPVMYTTPYPVYIFSSSTWRWVWRQSASGRRSSASLTRCPHTILIISICKISCFHCHAANSIPQFCILFQSVFFFAPPPSLFFHPLLLISIHCASALWILSGPPPFSSSPAKLKWFLLETTACNDRSSLLQRAAHRTVRQVTTTSTFPIWKPVQHKADWVLQKAEATLICAAALIRKWRGESSGLRSRVIRLFLNKPLKTSEDEDYSSQLFQLEQCPPDNLRELKNPALFYWLASSLCSVCGGLKDQLRKFHIALTMKMRGNAGAGSFVLFNTGSLSVVHSGCNKHSSHYIPVLKQLIN